MTVKDDTAAALEASRGTVLSGAAMAAAAGVSRTAVSKAVASLKADDGWPIRVIPGSGYLLEPDADILSKAGIEARLGDEAQRFDLSVERQVTSTNSLLRAAADAGAAEGRVIVAEAQSAGRGRLGRSFHSPAGTGLYLSILLRPGTTPHDALPLTCAAAVAVARAVDRLRAEEDDEGEAGHDPTRIKWVNDLFAGKRKVAGILTEASFDAESGTIAHAVCGIGINVYAPTDGFPAALADNAGYLFDHRVADARNRLAAGILHAFGETYAALPERDFIDEYRARSLLTGRRISVIGPGGTKDAVALGIDDDFGLRVRFDDGHEACLNSGEVSIRPR